MSASQPINPSRRNAWLRLWPLWLVLSLLLSQTLGQLHAVKHAVKHGGPVAHEHAPSQHVAQDAHHDQHDDGFLDILFSSHASDSDCRLYDQLSGGQAMPVLVGALLPTVLPSVQVAIFAGEALARWAALFDARGPPLTF